jgi:hypothetical protein
VLALLVAGPLALLARQPALLSALRGAVGGGGGLSAARGARSELQAAGSGVGSQGVGSGQPLAGTSAAATTAVLQMLSSLAPGWAAGVAARGGGGGARQPGPTSRPGGMVRPAAGGLGGAQLSTAGGGGGGGGSEAAGPPVQMVSVVADAKVSPYQGATWGEVIRHMTDRLRFSDPRFKLDVIGEAELQVGGVRLVACCRLGLEPLPQQSSHPPTRHICPPPYFLLPNQRSATQHNALPRTPPRATPCAGASSRAPSPSSRPSGCRTRRSPTFWPRPPPLSPPPCSGTAPPPWRRRTASTATPRRRPGPWPAWPPGQSAGAGRRGRRAC